MSDTPYEPYVIVDRSAAPASGRRWTVFRGRKPALLLIDRGGPEGSRLDLPLASEGFEVYRTTGRASAVDLLRAHPSILMALVRTDLADVEAPSLIRELRETQPGLWIGLLCEPGNRDCASAGYAAGASDLFDLSANPQQTVSRLIRSAPYALRLREAADRRRERHEQRRPEPVWRRLLRKSSSQLRVAGLVAVSLALGVGLAVATQAWQESQQRWSERFDRLVNALEGSRAAPDRVERQLRIEQLGLQQQSLQATRQSHLEQLEQSRVLDLLRAVPPPQYSVR